MIRSRACVCIAARGSRAHSRPNRLDPRRVWMATVGGLTNDMYTQYGYSYYYDNDNNTPTTTSSAMFWTTSALLAVSTIWTLCHRFKAAMRHVDHADHGVGQAPPQPHPQDALDQVVHRGGPWLHPVKRWEVLVSAGLDDPEAICHHHRLTGRGTNKYVARVRCPDCSMVVTRRK